MAHVGSILGWRFGRRRSVRRPSGFFPLLVVASLSLVGSSVVAGIVFGAIKRLT